VKVLVLYDYPPSAGGLATQGDLLFKGLRELGVDVYRHTSTRPRKKHGITGGSNPMWLLASDIGGTHRI
jgi:hypothetical protein